MRAQNQGLVRVWAMIMLPWRVRGTDYLLGRRQGRIYKVRTREEAPATTQSVLPGRPELCSATQQLWVGLFVISRLWTLLSLHADGNSWHAGPLCRYKALSHEMPLSYFCDVSAGFFPPLLSRSCERRRRKQIWNSAYDCRCGNVTSWPSPTPTSSKPLRFISTAAVISLCWLHLGRVSFGLQPITRRLLGHKGSRDCAKNAVRQEAEGGL